LIYYFVLFALAACVNIVLGLHAWPAVLAGSLNDPDSYMRLLRIEQGIRAGHFVTTVAGDASGQGVMVEWSRLLDYLLWLLAVPLAPFFGWHRALFAAGVALGPLGVGFFGAVLAWAVEPFAEHRYLWSAALAAAILPGLLTIAMPGIVHYHILLLAMIALTAGFAARAWRDDRWAGFLAGVSGGFAIWLTPETMPFVLMAYAALLLRWWDARNATTMLATAAGCFDVLIIALFVDPPYGGYGVPEIDRNSLVYVVMALLLLGGTMLLTRLEQRLKRACAPAGVAVMAVVLAAWVAAFPKVAEGPYGVLPPDQARAFFGVMTELQPLRGADLFIFLFPGACAVAYAFWRAVGGLRTSPLNVPGLLVPDSPRRGSLMWMYLAVCGAVALVLGARFLLFVGFSTAFAAALLPVALSELSLRFSVQPAMAGAARLGTLLLVLGVPELAAIAEPAPKAQMPARVYPSCSLRHIAPLLAQAAGKVVLALPDDTPELLYRTQVETVGSLYQHGVPAYMRDRAAWRAAPGAEMAPEITATGAVYVLFCPIPGRHVLVMDLPKNTLWDALEAGTPPPWLTPAGTDAAGWALYKVKP
jgi:hypothetical protein